MDSQLDSLKQAGVARVFSEKISTRAVRQPQLERAVDFARARVARELRASGVEATHGT